MRIVSKIIIAIALVFTISTLGIGVYIYLSPNVEDQFITPLIEFGYEKNNQKLTVDNINFNVDWEYISLQGDAILPDGTVKPGDEIINCYGDIRLYLSNDFIGEWTFPERQNNFEDIQFSGEWYNSDENVELKFDFYSNSFEYDYPDSDNQSYLIIPQSGNYDAFSISKEIFFYNNMLREFAIYNFSIDNKSDKLFIESNEENLSLNRRINNISDYEDILLYDGQKIRIKGVLNISENESIGNLIFENNTNITIVLDGYINQNVSLFDGKEVEIVGFIFLTDESLNWNVPYIRYIESIFVI